MRLLRVHRSSQHPLQHGVWMPWIIQTLELVGHLEICVSCVYVFVSDTNWYICMYSKRLLTWSLTAWYCFKYFMVKSLILIIKELWYVHIFFAIILFDLVFWSLLQFKGYIYLNLSFYFNFASTFISPDTFSSTGPK